MDKRRQRVTDIESARLRADLARIPVRTARGGGGGGMTIETYTVFPAIPSSPTLISCKSQLWYAQSGYTRWAPLVWATAQTGEPGT